MQTDGLIGRKGFRAHFKICSRKKVSFSFSMIYSWSILKQIVRRGFGAAPFVSPLSFFVYFLMPLAPLNLFQDCIVACLLAAIRGHAAFKASLNTNLLLFFLGDSFVASMHNSAIRNFGKSIIEYLLSMMTIGAQIKWDMRMSDHHICADSSLHVLCKR